MSNGFRRRIFMGRPGIYATKMVSPTTEVHIPFLQSAICCLILLLDALFVLSWGLILPVGIICVASTIAITVLIPTMIAGLFFGFRKVFDWMGIFPKVLMIILSPVQFLRLFTLPTVRRTKNFAENKLLPTIVSLGEDGSEVCVSLKSNTLLAGTTSMKSVLFQKRYLQIDKALSEFPAWVEERWTTISISTAVIAFLLTVLAFALAHDAWHNVCVNLPHVDLPIPHASGDWGAIGLGIFLALVGIIGFAFRPGRYPLGMTAFGGIVMAVAQYFRPVSIEIEYGWTLTLYAIWGSLCLAFIVGTGTLLLRFYIRELLEYSDYPEQRAGLEEDVEKKHVTELLALFQLEDDKKKLGEKIKELEESQKRSGYSRQ